MFRWVAFAVGVLIVVCTIFTWPKFTTGAPVPASRWILDVMHVQDGLARGDVEHRIQATSENGRLLYVGGSSGLFGVDGLALERLTGREVVNLALHASFSVEWQLLRAERLAREGDLVVAAFELPAYYREGLTTFEQEQSLLWRAIGYRFADPAYEFTVTWRTSMETLAQYAMANAVGAPTEFEMKSYETALAEWGLARGGELSRPDRPYSSLWLDDFGAINVPRPPEGRALAARGDTSNYAPHSGDPAASPRDRIEQAANRLRSRGATLIVVPPPLMAFEGGGINGRPDAVTRIQALLDGLSERGIEAPCEVEALIQEPEDFYDTVYHLNAWGAADRAFRLAHCINGTRLESPRLSGRFGYWPEVLTLRSERDDTRPWETWLLEMFELTEALEAYRSEFGAYPESQLWDGVRTDWGAERQDWIDGLAPRFISSLPEVIDLRFSYLYRSDGEEFKIILQAHEYADEVTQIAPIFIDPKRPFAIRVSSSSITDQW